MQVEYDDFSSPAKAQPSPLRRSPRRATPHPGSGAIARPKTHPAIMIAKKAAEYGMPANLSPMPSDTQDFQGEVFYDNAKNMIFYDELPEARWTDEILNLNTSIIGDGMVKLAHAIIIIAHRNQPDTNVNTGGNKEARYKAFGDEVSAMLRSILFVTAAGGKAAPLKGGKRLKRQPYLQPATRGVIVVSPWLHRRSPPHVAVLCSAVPRPHACVRSLAPRPRRS